MNYQYHPLIKENRAPKQNKSKLIGIHDLIFNLHTPFELLEKGKIIVLTTIQSYMVETNLNMITNSTNITLYGNVEVSTLKFL